MLEIPISEPDWSSTFDDVLEIDLAHSFWRTYVNEMASTRTLTEANAPALEHLVILRVLVQRALRQCISAGLVLQPKKSNPKGMARQNPHATLAASLGRQAVALEDALGLSPSARNRAGQVRRATAPSRPSDAYLKPLDQIPAARFIKSLSDGVIPLRRKRK